MTKAHNNTAKTPTKMKCENIKMKAHLKCL